MTIKTNLMYTYNNTNNNNNNINNNCSNSTSATTLAVPNRNGRSRRRRIKV